MRLLRGTCVGLAIVGPALAHSWYPPDCCGDKDCQPVPCEQLAQLTDGGYLDVRSQLTFGKPVVQPSRDGACHECVHNGAPLCLFIQPPTT
jgi:hypothetical protein